MNIVKIGTLKVISYFMGDSTCNFRICAACLVYQGFERFITILLYYSEEIKQKAKIGKCMSAPKSFPIDL